MHLKQTLRLGTVRGIPVGLHWSLLLVAVLYLVSMATAMLPGAGPDASVLTYWAVAALGVVLFFASVLGHEFAHAAVARREGIGVRAITLFVLGGVAEIEEEATEPGTEFRIAAAGPAASLAIGAVLCGVAIGLGRWWGPSVIGTMFFFIGVINLALGVFNLVPAAPLDGGRILTAVLWRRSGDAYGARATSARAGQVFGGLLVLAGVVALLNGGGFWVLITAWFVYGSATAERRRAQLFSAAERRTVGDVMATLASPTDPAVTAAGLAAMGGANGRVAFPVRGADGTLMGIVPGPEVGGRRSPAPDTRADTLVVPWARFVSARSGELLSAVLDRFRTSGLHHAIVYDDADQPVGYVGVRELFAAQAAAATSPEA